MCICTVYCRRIWRVKIQFDRSRLSSLTQRKEKIERIDTLRNVETTEVKRNSSADLPHVCTCNMVCSLVCCWGAWQLQNIDLSRSFNMFYPWLGRRAWDFFASHARCGTYVCNDSISDSWGVGGTSFVGQLVTSNNTSNVICWSAIASWSINCHEFASFKLVKLNHINLKLKDVKRTFKSYQTQRWVFIKPHISSSGPQLFAASRSPG